MAQKLNNQESHWHETTLDLDAGRPLELDSRDKGEGITAANHNFSVARIGDIVYMPFIVLEVLLAIRVVLSILGVNAENPFINLLYGVTAPFVSLFAGLLQNPVLNTTSVLEITTLIAMAVYGIAAWLIGRLIWMMLSSPRYG